MTRFHERTPFIVVIATLVFFISCDQSDTAETDAIAFIDANVLPMDREVVLENHTVIVENGRITAVGPSTNMDVPPGAQTIDASGRYLLPGLAEMHGHIPGPNDMEYLENILFLFVSNGITTVRNMSGHPYHVELRERIQNGDVLGPSLYAASPWLGPGQATTAEETDELIRSYAETGYDQVKVGNPSREVYMQMAETANEIGLRFGGHIPPSVRLDEALEAGQESIDHLDRYIEFISLQHPAFEDTQAGFFGSGLVDLVDRDRIPLAVERTLEAGAWNIPTLTLIGTLENPESAEEMIEWPEMQYMPQEIRDSWVSTKNNYRSRDYFQQEAATALVELRGEILHALHEARAPIILGSDAPQWFNVPGFSTHHEMQMMVDAGLTPYEVLVTGTRNPAIYLDTPDDFGTVEVNRRADLMLLEANPLEDISNVQQRAGVMVRGQWISENDIRERLNQISEQYR